MSTASSAAQPIFIAGISQRSGTNFLYDLLRLHPDCGTMGANWEDSSLAYAEHLICYVESVTDGWRRHGAVAKIDDLLYENLGNSVLSTLSMQIDGKRLITKTPNVRNLNYFFKFFPRACLLILVRDGRAVVESRVKTFGESYDVAIRIWANGAESILRFVQIARDSEQRYRIVKYEGLCNNLETELRGLFEFLGLDESKYDFAAATNLPVRGSSVFRGTRPREYHWDPVEKTADFKPVKRWQDWSRYTHERFNWIGGRQLVALGYQQEKFEESNKLLWKSWNRLQDLGWQVKGFTQSALTLMKNILKLAFGAERMSRCRRQIIGSLRNIFNLKRALSQQ